MGVEWKILAQSVIGPTATVADMQQEIAEIHPDIAKNQVITVETSEGEFLVSDIVVTPNGLRITAATSTVHIDEPFIVNTWRYTEDRSVLEEEGYL